MEDKEGWGGDEKPPDLSLELLVNEVKLKFNDIIKLKGIGFPSVLRLFCTFVL